MNVIGASLVGMALQLVVGVVVWWLRLRWQLRLERQRGQHTARLAGQLRGTGGRLREQRVDGSVVDLTVIGPEHGQ